MARGEPGRGVVPSLLDRLIDSDETGHGTLLGFELNQMIESVRRDLEDLLNTRQSHQGIPDRFVELRDSIVAFGLPDFSSIDVTRGGQKREMGAILVAIINRFEPRLRDVSATAIDDPTQGATFRVAFQIRARLRLDPNPEIGFDTVIELLSGHTSVSQRGDRDA